jgi:uncharacterized protein YkwD
LPSLDEVARAWSVRMASSGRLAHNPSYPQQIPAGWAESGENVAWSAPSARDVADLAHAVHDGWLHSADHRANLEDPAYTAVGIGIAFDARNGFYVTQDFAAYASGG